MASELDNLLQGGLSELESVQSDAGVAPQITVGGFTWPCVKGSKKVGKQFQVGGFTYDFDYEIHIRKNAVSSDGSTVFSTITQPVSGDRVTDGSTVYRISFVDTAQGAFVALFLIDTAKP